MPTPSRLFALFAFTLLLSARAADASHPWEADAFLPLTEQRLAALPSGEQRAWNVYWDASKERAKLLPPRDLVDHSPTQAVPVGTFKGSYSQGVKLNAPAAWYASAEARTIADRVVKWQRPTGGWVKSGDYSRDPLPADDHHDAWSNGTFDNDSTIYELRFLALVAAQDPGEAERARVWRESFLRGLGYIFAAQYPNGGFPQIYPLVGWYHDAITFNDDAMVHILELCRDIAGRNAEFAFVPAVQATRAGEAVARGIQCVLATQMRDASGHRTVWGQQHDPLTLKPCAARNFEPISQCSSESAGLTQFLMTVPSPSPDIVAAVDGAVAWFPAHALHGVAWDRNPDSGNALVPRANAPDLWARYYEIGTDRPVFGDRDRTVHYNVTEISIERRRGYAWFNSRAAALPAAYAAWKAKR